MSSFATFAAVLLVFAVVPSAAAADPVTAAIATALSVSTTTAAFILRIGISLALSALSVALASKPERGRRPGIKTETTTTGGTNPQSFILGKYATAGNMAAPPYSHPNSGAVPNKYLTYAVDVSDLPGVTLERVIVGAEYVTDLVAAASGDHALEGMVVDGTPHLMMTWHDGRQVAADAYMRANYHDHPDRPWQMDMVGTGVAYGVVTFLYNRKLFNQLPGVRFEVMGIPLYDPRQDDTAGGSGSQRWDAPASWAQTANPAVMIYNILRGIALPDGKTWGGRVAAEDLPLDSWFAAMNECDVAVDLAGGGSEPQYAAGLEVGFDDQPAAVIDELLKACSGEICEFGGIYKMRAGAPALPVYFFSDDDVVADLPQSLAPYPGLDGVYNAIHASHPSPDELWEPRDAPPRYNAEWEAEDGGRQLVAEVELPAVASGTQAQRLMKAWIEDERRFRRHGMTLPPDAAVLEPLDTAAWTSAREGYTSKLFEVAEVSDDLESCLQTVAVRERDPGDSAWVPGDEIPVVPQVPVVTVPAPLVVFGFTAGPVILTDAAGASRRPGIRIGWDPDISGYRGLQWRIRVNVPGGQVLTGSTAALSEGQLDISAAVLPAESYLVSARLLSDLDSAWTAEIAVVTPDVRIAEADLAAEIPAAIAAAMQDAADAGSAAADAQLAADQASQAAADAGNQVDLVAGDLDALEASASASFVLRAVAGGQSGELEIVAYSNAQGGGSAILAKADRFIAAGSITAPLVGTNQLIAHAANIASGVIASAHIGNLEVENAHVANLTLDGHKMVPHGVTEAREVTLTNTTANAVVTFTPELDGEVLVWLTANVRCSGSGNRNSTRTLKINGTNYATISTSSNVDNNEQGSSEDWGTRGASQSVVAGVPVTVEAVQSGSGGTTKYLTMHVLYTKR